MVWVGKSRYDINVVNNIPSRTGMMLEAEILLSRAEIVAVISKKIGVSAHTYYLKKLVADLSLDNVILKEASRGNC